MIELKNVNKYYGKKNKSQHVLQDISFSLPSTGFVAICGESGCGKTTLLNCIGGTDNAYGLINLKDKRFGKTNAGTDKFRSRNIGYIYQDYCLIEEETVKYNIQLAIDIAETSDTNDDERIFEVLKVLEMERYLNRKVKTLSGGQKQRVAIARAIINKPLLLLADEPTGHLDSKNTKIVMDILKQLSKTLLVVLVSHEQQLVDYYADTIIKLENGKIVKNYKNPLNAVNESPFFEHTLDSNIYLEDYIKQTISKSDCNIETYTDNSSIPSIRLIVSKNKIFINVLDGSPVEIIDSSKIKETKEDLIKPFNDIVPTKNLLQEFLQRTVKITEKKRNKNDYSGIFHFTKKKTFAIVGFIFSAIFLAISMSFLNLNSQVEEYKFLQFHKNAIQIDSSSSFNSEDIETICSAESVIEILPYNSQYIFELKDNNFLQMKNSYMSMNLSACVLSYKYADSIIVGRKPKNQYEVLIDEMTATATIRGDSFQNISASEYYGYISPNNFINSTIYVDENTTLTIVGITKSSSPAIYVSENMLMTLAFKYTLALSNTLYTDLSITNVTELPANQVLLDVNTYTEGGYDENNNEYEILGKKYKIAGIFNGNYNNAVVMNINDAKQLFWEKYLLVTKTLILLSLDTANSLIELNGNNFYVNSIYEIYRLNYEASIKRSQDVRNTLTALVLGISIIIYWMTEKSKILSRLNSISVKRAIGIKKSALVKSFISESCLTILIFCTPAYLLTILLIFSISSSLGTILSISAVSLINLLLGLIILFLIAIFTTLFSCLGFLNKSPATLLKYKQKND